jgi:hypothetical protein
MSAKGAGMSTASKSIAYLQGYVQALPTEERARFERIFKVTTTVGEVRAPESMHQWIVKFFGSLEAVQKQRIVKVTNLITLDAALFNELRASRPMESRADADLEKTIMANLGDPFCKPLEGTPEDVFGRVKGKRCITASNVAKYDGFHGLVIFDEHNPLRFTPEGVQDYVDTALSWAREAHCSDKEARYFFLMWNCLWRSGASILHGHMQMTLGRGMHYAKVEHLRRSALLYNIAHGTDYFDDLYAAHRSLGLATEVGDVRILSYLTPIKEREVILVSRHLDRGLKHAIYNVLDTLVSTMGVKSFNLALYMQPIDSVPEDWSGFPFVVRIVDRGDPNNKTADFGAMELYASSVVTSDPFQVAPTLASSFHA